MPATTSCAPCCSEPLVTQVPGPEGLDGDPGTNGVNAFSITTADFVIPAIGNTVTVSLDTSAWMVIGQIVVFAGPATFRVTALPNSTSATLEFLGYAGDLAPGVIITTGTQVSPSGAQPALNTVSAIATGTAYVVTASYGLIDFTGGGSVDPTITLPSAGDVYLIFARARFDYDAATFAANETCSIKLRCTNNTVADLTNGSAVFPTDIITTLSYPAWDLQTPPVVYTVAGANDVIELWAELSNAPGAGDLKCTAASIVALKIS